MACKSKTKKMAGGGLTTNMFGQGRVMAVKKMAKPSTPSKPSKPSKFGGK